MFVFFPCLSPFSVTDQKHNKDQEDEEETAEEDREERHAGYAAEDTEAELQNQRAKKQHWQRADVKTENKHICTRKSLNILCLNLWFSAVTVRND